jgi:hypothetical protein
VHVSVPAPEYPERMATPSSGPSGESSGPDKTHPKEADMPTITGELDCSNDSIQTPVLWQNPPATGHARSLPKTRIFPEMRTLKFESLPFGLMATKMASWLLVPEGTLKDVQMSNYGRTAIVEFDCHSDADRCVQRFKERSGRSPAKAEWWLAPESGIKLPGLRKNRCVKFINLSPECTYPAGVRKLAGSFGPVLKCEVASDRRSATVDFATSKGASRCIKGFSHPDIRVQWAFKLGPNPPEG